VSTGHPTLEGGDDARATTSRRREKRPKRTEANRSEPKRKKLPR
jgi:hypothetical protein